MSKLIGRLLAVLAFGWAGSASADLIRYDISGKSDDYTLGSMWFWDAGPTPGNIMPNLYKWSFNYDDRAPINHLNSSLSESFGSAFTVGHAGEVLPPDTYTETVDLVGWTATGYQNAALIDSSGEARSCTFSAGQFGDIFAHMGAWFYLAP